MYTATVMFRIFTLLILLCSSAGLSAQNLVINGGFEPADCPPTGTTINDIIPPWRQGPFSSADHYGPCTFIGSPTTNNNISPRSGDGNVGLYAYGNFGSTYNRENLIGELSTTLRTGQFYRVSYWVHPVVVNAVGINAAINGPDVLFLESPFDLQTITPSDYGISSDSALYPADAIIDRDGWTQVCLNFYASGFERYIAIGTFRKDEQINAELIGTGPSPDLGYYLIDDVVVEPIDPPVLSGTYKWCPGDEITLSVPEGLNGVWEDGTTAITRVVDAPGTYSYGYQDGICYRTNSVDVIEVNCETCSVYAPNAFTPNGDGLNDTWKPEFECPPIEYRLEIFDRLGNLVFLTHNPDEGWSPPSGEHEDTYVAHLVFTYELYGDRDLIEEKYVINLLR